MAEEPTNPIDGLIQRYLVGVLVCFDVRVVMTIKNGYFSFPP